MLVNVPAIPGSLLPWASCPIFPLFYGTIPVEERTYWITNQIYLLPCRTTRNNRTNQSYQYYIWSVQQTDVCISELVASSGKSFQSSEGKGKPQSKTVQPFSPWKHSTIKLTNHLLVCFHSHRRRRKLLEWLLLLSRDTVYCTQKV